MPADWQRYIVGPFDTLAFIAQRFNLSPEQLARANCLTQPSITVGQALYVPGFRPAPTVVPCYPPFNWAVYVVQPGDTLSAIAQRYGISLYTLMRGNCLTTAYIYAGQRLFVPPTFPIRDIHADAYRSNVHAHAANRLTHAYADACQYFADTANYFHSRPD